MPPTFVTLKGLVAKPELNGVLARVVKWCEDDRVGVALPALHGGKSIRVKQGKFDAGVDADANYWDEPAHARTHFSHDWSLSSRRGMPDKAPEFGQNLAKAPFASLFIDQAFPNLTSVVMKLVSQRGLKIMASGHLVGNGAGDYLDPLYDPNKCKHDLFDLVEITPMIVLSTGHLERLMHAGLQLIHASGRTEVGLTELEEEEDDEDADDDDRVDAYTYMFMEDAEERIVNVKARFRYNGKDVSINLLQHDETTGGKPWLVLATGDSD